MRKQEIIDKVNAAIAGKAGISAGDIKPTDYYDDLGVDEVMFLDALLEIEDSFVISVPSLELLHVATMQDVYSLVERLVVETHGFQVY